jgi:hypothetical protein
MPPEPSNRADERLRQYAEKRRAESGDFALHPATRRMLQGEVARHYAAGRARAGAGGIFAWLTRWRLAAYAAACLAVLGTGAWLATDSIRKNAPASMAKMDSNVASAYANQPVTTEAVPPPTVTSSAVAAKDAPAKPADPAKAKEAGRKDADQMRGTGGERRAEQPITRSLARKAGPPKEAVETDGAMLDKSRVGIAGGSMPAPAAAPYATTPVPAPVTPPASAAAPAAEMLALSAPPATRFFRLKTADAPPASTLSSGTTLPEQGATRQLKFEQADRVDAFHLAKAAREQSVALDNFTFEQRGNVVRVTDADGSVYEGAFVVNESSPAADAAVGRMVGADAPAASPARSNDVPFRVSGTNRTLKQLIVLDGRLTTPPLNAALQLEEKKKRAEDMGTVATNTPALEGSLRVGDAAPVFYRARARN